MNKLMIALIASTFVATAAAQTGTVDPATVSDHGTPAMHAQESKKNFEASKAVGIPDTKARQQEVKDATKGSDHGTPAIHAADAQRNANVSKGKAKPITSNKVGQEAVKDAVKGQTK